MPDGHLPTTQPPFAALCSACTCCSSHCPVFTPGSPAASPFLCPAGTRYSSYCANICRTFLVDPTKRQEEEYAALLAAQVGAAAMSCFCDFYFLKMRRCWRRRWAPRRWFLLTNARCLVPSYPCACVGGWRHRRIGGGRVLVPAPACMLAWRSGTCALPACVRLPLPAAASCCASLCLWFPLGCARINACSAPCCLALALTTSRPSTRP